MVGGDPRCCELLLYNRAQLGIADENGWQEIHQVSRVSRKPWGERGYLGFAASTGLGYKREGGVLYRKEDGISVVLTEEKVQRLQD